MRRLPLTLLAACVCLTAATGQDPAPARDPIPWANKFFTGSKDDPPPVILQDFGTLPKGTVRTYRFPMSNIYAIPMTVREPRNPDCRCVSITEYTGKMLPHETGHIEIKIDTSKVEGPKTVRLPITFEGKDPRNGEPFFSTALLEVRAISQPDIAINPGAVVFGVVPMGRGARQTVNIVYSGQRPGWGITALEYRKDFLEVVAQPVPVRGGGRNAVAYQVTASLKANAPAGRVDEAIVLKTNDPAVPALTLSVSGAVQAPLTLLGPDKDGLVRLGQVEVGKKSQKNVIVQSDKDFVVRAVDGQGDGVSVPVLKDAPANKVQPLMVTFEPTKPGPVKKELTIRTSTGESVRMTVEAVGTDPR